MLVHGPDKTPTPSPGGGGGGVDYLLLGSNIKFIW